MLKTFFKIFAVSIAVFSLATCDNYEFPKSPYPRIETLPVANISNTGVTFQGNITQLGEKEITNHGFDGDQAKIYQLIMSIRFS